MLTREEYHQITRDILPKVFIQIPPECIIVRVRDVMEILHYFTEKEKPNGGQILHSTDGDSKLGSSSSSVHGDGGATITDSNG